MIEVMVETEWQGMVAVRQQFLEQARLHNEDIMIFHEKGRMRIPYQEVYTRVARKSEWPMRDKFRKYKPGYLYYYNWKPDEVQAKMEV